MSTKLLFEQLENIREKVSIPLIIMGYFNPVLQYGVDAFCKKCKEVGIDGLILPDLPLAEYEEHYRSIFESYGLINIFLITPQTSETRVKEIDKASNGFIYMVSSASTTGSKNDFGDEQTSYFERIASLALSNPQIVGFGISNAATFSKAIKRSNGAIIGSAFIKELTLHGIEGISNFIRSIR